MSNSIFVDNHILIFFISGKHSAAKLLVYPPNVACRGSKPKQERLKGSKIVASSIIKTSVGIATKHATAVRRDHHGWT
jgi:hypothetical protein